MKLENLQKQKGITLIALVVTIVVLLILAGISINAILGNNGLISKAKQAKEEQAHAQVKDAMELLWGEYQIEIITAQENGVKELAKFASLQLAATEDTISTFLDFLITKGVTKQEVLVIQEQEILVEKILETKNKHQQ